jgi:N-acetylneuraminic acid mutarotase
MANQNGAYGVQGTPATNNAPGARNFGAVGWTDKSGNFWLFGGNGFDSVGTNSANGGGELNDLWEYNISNKTWTWVSGLKTIGQAGTPPPANVPGARDSGASWVDASGNLWLFGGNGFDSTGTLGLLNDLWKFNIGSGQWTQVSSSSTANQNGTYGTQGVATTTNVPGARSNAYSWMDSSGNFWVFGGFGFDSAGNNNDMNDLWEYSVTTGEWTWINGPNLATQPIVGTPTLQGESYGTEGTLAPSNIPGDREAGVSWIDSSGNLWLFGGTGINDANDLWMYEP